ncbi:hypothetical protein RDI58_029179 [Solanum bulbocastanum]|uniref:Uncharacterized protein n=1 Tax=Solanum bulbocastanum TaxID=147425 RepID=A0AAN8ST58_SOLBU
MQFIKLSKRTLKAIDKIQ